MAPAHSTPRKVQKLGTEGGVGESSDVALSDASAERPERQKTALDLRFECDEWHDKLSKTLRQVATKVKAALVSTAAKLHSCGEDVESEKTAEKLEKKAALQCQEALTL